MELVTSAYALALAVYAAVFAISRPVARLKHAELPRDISVLDAIADRRFIRAPRIEGHVR